MGTQPAKSAFPHAASFDGLYLCALACLLMTYLTGSIHSSKLGLKCTHTFTSKCLRHCIVRLASTDSEVQKYDFFTRTPSEQRCRYFYGGFVVLRHYKT